MITRERLTPMLKMTDAEIDGLLMAGLYGRDFAEMRRRREHMSRRDECQYERQSDIHHLHRKPRSLG
ncbi:MAG: hypothetical protein II877_02490 [Synergistaceae bacterium]|nr:hypothetical protein [Synergistaceae bacterium]